MQEITPTWTHIRSIWWLIVWRGAVGGTLVGFVLGFIWGVMGAIAGIKNVTPGATILGALGGLIW